MPVGYMRSHPPGLGRHAPAAWCMRSNTTASSSLSGTLDAWHTCKHYVSTVKHGTLYWSGMQAGSVRSCSRGTGGSVRARPRAARPSGRAGRCASAAGTHRGACSPRPEATATSGLPGCTQASARTLSRPRRCSCLAKFGPRCNTKRSPSGSGCVHRCNGHLAPAASCTAALSRSCACTGVYCTAVMCLLRQSHGPDDWRNLPVKSAASIQE